MKPKIVIDEGLLFRYFQDDVTEAERHAVIAWLQAGNEADLNILKGIIAATAQPLLTATNTEAAWRRMKSSTIAQHKQSPEKRVLLMPVTWLRAAAVLLVCLALSFLWQQRDKHRDKQQQVVVIKRPAQPVMQSVSKPEAQASLQETKALTNTEPTVTGKREHALTPPRHLLSSISGAPDKREAICNSTACPLEICVLQAVDCNGKPDSGFAHCSLLRPGESAMLSYEFPMRGRCAHQIRGISIRRINTGETIVLNDSTSVTAQEFYDYATGVRKGAITAGIFAAACDNSCRDDQIILRNNYGMPVLQ